jgi:hypothetical protein
VGVPDGWAVIGARVSPMLVGAALVGAAGANAPMDTRRRIVATLGGRAIPAEPAGLHSGWLSASLPPVMCEFKYTRPSLVQR